MSTDVQDLSSKEQHANLQAAIARTLTRGIALYFSRPVRLFRPSKVSGWHSLRVLASQQGSSLTPHYVLGLLKTQGFIVIPKHFIPPMLVNAFLGTVLWTTYTKTFDAIQPRFVNHSTFSAGLAGAVAGGAQALLAAPAENVRIALEGGSGGSSWSRAWQEVFRGTKRLSSCKKTNIEDIRRLRTWMKDVGDMAGRGWNGWGWGLGKDVCGFAAFFSVFELTRRAALSAKGAFQHFPDEVGEEDSHLIEHGLPRVIHGVTLVTGGVIAGLMYERVTLPWDVSRRLIELERIAHPPSDRATASAVILQKLRNDGLLSFFQAHGHMSVEHDRPSRFRRHIHNTLRTLGRVGPWGIGFLVWEVYGA